MSPSVNLTTSSWDPLAAPITSRVDPRRARRARPQQQYHRRDIGQLARRAAKEVAPRPGSIWLPGDLTLLRRDSGLRVLLVRCHRAESVWSFLFQPSASRSHATHSWAGIATPHNGYRPSPARHGVKRQLQRATICAEEKRYYRTQVWGIPDDRSRFEVVCKDGPGVRRRGLTRLDMAVFGSRATGCRWRPTYRS